MKPGRLPMRRSARAVVGAACLLLPLLPLLLLGFSFAYESVILRSIRRDLEALAAAAPHATPDALPALGRRGQAQIYLLHRDGSIRAQSATGPESLDASLVGTLAEHVLSGLWASPAARRLADIEGELGDLATRPEVRQALAGQRAFALKSTPSGQVAVVHLAVPQPDGGVLYLGRGSRRGLRQLFLVRHELLKLILYESVFALLLGIFLSRHLLHPLERMARAARRYPHEPLFDDKLLGRRDELGQLARAIAGLAGDLEARRRATADLGADVAHAFKNPLATIAASVEFLGRRQEGASPERVELVADHIQEAVTRLRRSLDALMSLLRLEATLKDEPREKVAYAELLADVLADYERDPRYAGFTLRAACDGDVGLVPMLPVRWEELLRNLLDNALVQPMTRREVRITVTRDGERVITTVRDFGPGVSAGNRDKIFRRFFSQRPADAPAGSGPGTGLGLSIVQAVAAAHGGQVEVHAPEDGPGALFTLTMTAT